ncbi:MAG: PHP domain-containing protein, partial [Promethearchaeia archaeon]
MSQKNDGTKIDFLKKNKTLSVVLIGFLVWISILIIVVLTTSREVLFLDYGVGFQDGQPSNLSEKYSSVIPILRYVIEPIIGITLVFDSMGYDIIMGFIYSMIILRIGGFIFKKLGYLQSEKAKLLWYPIKDWIRFSFIVISIGIISSLLLILILFLTIGFYWVNLNFMPVIQVCIIISLSLMIMKALILVIRYIHPRLSLNYGSKKRYNLPETRSTKTKIFRAFRKEFFYVMGISFILVGSTMFLQMFHFPIHRIEADLEDGEVLLDFHSHTCLSDGWLTPEERVDYYIAHGIDGAAISDHDNLRGAKRAKEYVEGNDLDFTVFLAQEWSGTDLHLLIYGLEEVILPERKDFPQFTNEFDETPKIMNASETIKYVNQTEGAYTIVAHYNAYNDTEAEHIGELGSPYTFDQLKEWGVDGFETVNTYFRDPRIREYCVDNDLICIGSTDVHSNEGLNAFVNVKLNNTDDYDLDDVFGELRKNTHEIVAIEGIVVFSHISYHS